MARGWESKAVEGQIEEAEKVVFDQPTASELTPELRARRDRLESLRLSRARTLSQLENATRPPHRELLQRTLRAVELEIEELSQQT
ncbi:MAG: hypothetical protein QOJ64_3975 [Acidobacteriota bacterium]|jgi:hypothetical protein|nr:hypothetical protein [Acidobacteriota bacterium]